MQDWHIHIVPDTPETRVFFLLVSDQMYTICVLVHNVVSLRLYIVSNDKLTTPVEASDMKALVIY